MRKISFLEKFQYVFSWYTDVVEYGGEMIRSVGYTPDYLYAYNFSQKDAMTISALIYMIAVINKSEISIGWKKDTDKIVFSIGQIAKA